MILSFMERVLTLGELYDALLVKTAAGYLPHCPRGKEGSSSVNDFIDAKRREYAALIDKFMPARAATSSSKFFSRKTDDLCFPPVIPTDRDRDRGRGDGDSNRERLRDRERVRERGIDTDGGYSFRRQSNGV